jgi:hypothetical protein
MTIPLSSSEAGVSITPPVEPEPAKNEPPQQQPAPTTLLESAVAATPGVKLEPLKPTTDASGNEVWYYPTHNADGISYTYQCRGVPQLQYWMNEIVHSRRFPYRNKQDIVRHALHRHMLWLQSHIGCIRAPGTVQIELMRMLEAEEYEQSGLHMFQKMDKLVRVALDAGNPEAAKRLAKRLWGIINQVEEGPWRRHFVKEFEAKYRMLLR